MNNLIKKGVKTSSVTYYLNNVSTGTTDYYDYVND